MGMSPELYCHFRKKLRSVCYKVILILALLTPRGDHNRNKRSAVLIFKLTEAVEAITV